MAIVLRVEQRHVQHVAVAAMVGTHHILPHHTPPRQGVEPAVQGVAVVLVAQDHVGQKLVRQWFTHLAMCERSRQFAKRQETSIKPHLRDVFHCHAWDDRKGVAKELHDLLESLGVSVWFSEKDVLLGSNLHNA